MRPQPQHPAGRARPGDPPLNDAGDNSPEQLAALWRLSREEASALGERIALLERAVMAAMTHPPEIDSAELALAVLDQQRALDLTRARTARIVATLRRGHG